MANEKRLIDANALKDGISSLTIYISGLRAGKGVLDKFMKEYRWSVLKIIDQQATVDAVEVVHGRWNEINQITTGLPWKYRCNECGCPQDYKHNYCPNCGAKMDGDGNA